jgi:hypothetical protein
MKTNLAPYLGFAAAAAAAMLALTYQPAHADDITIDPTRFVSTANRADVRSDFIKYHPADGYSEWGTQQNGQTPFKSSQTSAQARSEYLQDRGRVHQLTAEDSGSTYLLMGRKPRTPESVMGASAR